MQICAESDLKNVLIIDGNNISYLIIYCDIEMFLHDGNKTEYTAHFSNNKFTTEDIQLPIDSGNMNISMKSEIVKFSKIWKICY